MASRDENRADQPLSLGRPTSHVAQDFSSSLDFAFGLSRTDDLERTINEKKQEVSNQSAELAAIEARLRAAEERLNAKQSGHGRAFATSGGSAYRNMASPSQRPSSASRRSPMPTRTSASSLNRPSSRQSAGRSANTAMARGTRDDADRDRIDHDESEGEEVLESYARPSRF